MKSNSQAGQDLWVVERIADPGTFLDVGCNHPFEWSNTALLEDLGWRGWGVDVAINREDWAKRPGTVAIQADATVLDYREIAGTLSVDYLSLDIDHASLAALQRILECGVTFSVATVEHDAYRFGDELREGQRRLLLDAGYRMERADVYADGFPGFPFEDWWVA